MDRALGALALVVAGAIAWFLFARRASEVESVRDPAGFAQDRGPYPYDQATSTIRGRVRVIGEPPRPAPAALTIHGDPVCSHAHPTPPANPEVQVSAAGEVANAIVYLADPELEDYEYPRETARTLVFDQKGCLYHPYVGCLMAGQALRFENSDETTHNVHLTSPNGMNGEWNLEQESAEPIVLTPLVENYYPAQKDIAIEFTCDKHTWMKARMGVLFHPFFAVTGSDGSFSLPGVVPGEYEVVVWHEVLGNVTRIVSVAKDMAVELDIGYVNSEN